MTAQSDKKIEEYYLLNPKSFTVLDSIYVYQSPFGDVTTAPAIDTEIKLKSEGEITQKLILRFLGVRNLRIQQPTWSVFNIGFLDISSIKEYMWENIQYLVKDTEEETISFSCKDFVVFVER